jgi:DNA polymerase III subunit delta'
MLARAVAQDQVGHAYLFLGASCSGKSTAAKIFAAAMNCERQPAAAPQHLNTPTPQHPNTSTSVADWRLLPCGECESCRRIAAGTHPEVLEVRPESKGGQNISVDQSREIRRNAALRPKMGKRRLFLIPNAEAFNEESANALLKTLEEPSPFVTLILCAPNPSQVLPTIRSRCQIVRFGLASSEEIAEALTSRGTTPEIARELARACGGRPGLALSWAQTPSVLQARRRVLDLFAQVVAAGEKASRDPALGVLSLRLAEQMRGLVVSEKGEEDGPARPAKVLHSENLEIGLGYLRDLLLLCERADPLLAQNQDRLPELAGLASRTSAAWVLEQIESVREAQQLLDRNVAPQVVLERMFWALLRGRLPVAGRLYEGALL